ncbi:hypothetical protein ACGFZK_18355 [Streptomyces sp. NPDC048257]|uniref:hypothetical protein n=1 Tax=Streptomyces sp. NPDC048257 TaxID=3365526 RepID=UPI00371A611C
MAGNPVHPAGINRSYAHAERIGFGVLMIGAPLLMLGAAFFHPPHGIESGAVPHGLVGYGALDGIEYMTWVAGKDDTGLDPVAMKAFINEALHTNAILIPVLLVFTLLPVGLIVLAVGLHRAGVAPGWLAALMPLGMVGVAGSLQYPVLLVISALALLVSFGTVGVKLLRAPSGEGSVAGPV